MSRLYGGIHYRFDSESGCAWDARLPRSPSRARTRAVEVAFTNRVGGFSGF
jgi:hypothetical protein